MPPPMTMAGALSVTPVGPSVPTYVCLYVCTSHPLSKSNSLDQHVIYINSFIKCFINSLCGV